MAAVGQQTPMLVCCYLLPIATKKLELQIYVGTADFYATLALALGQYHIVYHYSTKLKTNT